MHPTDHDLLRCYFKWCDIGTKCGDHLVECTLVEKQIVVELDGKQVDEY